jgi:hypothetical protein
VALIGGVERRLNAWRPSGKRFAVAKPVIDLAALPMRFGLDGFPTDYDQGQLGSCGPNSLAECFEFLGGFRASRLFAYYWTRATENDIDEDGGVTIPDLLDVAQTMGLPPEVTWPYDIARYRDQPPVIALVEAAAHRVIQQDPIADLEHLLYDLATRKSPVMMGFQVPSSISATGADGVVLVPGASDPGIGGHCVVAHFADREREMVRCTCHYGSAFGDAGCIWLPFDHWRAGNVADMRAIRAVS